NHRGCRVQELLRKRRIRFRQNVKCSRWRRPEAEMRQAVDSRMVAEIEEVVGGAGFDVPR
ncbi:hypothetical protein, partial [Mesorhizobium sp.]|uniref:hypothetical protein n=1 Tax=Mesorhizobium sp. TaxID=1871066 RepID=UPI0025ED3DD4